MSNKLEGYFIDNMKCMITIKNPNDVSAIVLGNQGIYIHTDKSFVYVSDKLQLNNIKRVARFYKGVILNTLGSQATLTDLIDTIDSIVGSNMKEKGFKNE